MNTLLHIEASPRIERSHSRKLGTAYVQAWRLAHPTGKVIEIDLAKEAPPFVNEDWVDGAYTEPEKRSPAAQAAMATSDRYVDQLLAADEIVIATPMYNLSVPAALKAWIDQIVRVGRTFAFSEKGLVGTVTGKRVRVIVASGSDMRPGTAYASYNFAESYLRAVLGFIGITDVSFVYAHSLNDGNPSREQSLVEAKQAVENLAKAA